MSEIFRIKSYDIQYLKDSGNVVIWTEQDRNAYYCTDTQRLKVFYNVNIATDFNCITVSTESFRKSIPNPENQRYYYVVETNCLYKYTGTTRGWEDVIVQKLTDSPAYMLDDEQRKLVGEGEGLLDNNGLLQNGSVVVRDSNKLIKAIASMSDTNDLEITTTFGGNVVIYPGGKRENITDAGVLSINTVDNDNYMYYNGRLSIADLDYDEGDIGFVDSVYNLNAQTDGDSIYPVSALIIDDLTIEITTSYTGSVLNFVKTITTEEDVTLTDNTTYSVSDVAIPGGTYKGVTVTITLGTTPNTNNYFTTQFECEVDNQSGIYPDVYTINLDTSDDLALYDTEHYPKVQGVLSNDGHTLTVTLFFIVQIVGE